jgi:hypothetical protein
MCLIPQLCCKSVLEPDCELATCQGLNFVSLSLLDVHCLLAIRNRDMIEGPLFTFHRVPTGDLFRIVEKRARSEIAANKPQIEPVTRSPLLSRIATFLPTIKAANADLECAAQSADAFTLEEQIDGDGSEGHSGSLIRSLGSSGDESDEACHRDELKDDSAGDAGTRIEMDLTCGLLDLQNEAAYCAAEATMQNGRSVEDALGNARSASLEQSPKLIVNGAEIVLPSDSHCSRQSEQKVATCCVAVEDATCSEADLGSGSVATCTDDALHGCSVLGSTKL